MLVAKSVIASIGFSECETRHLLRQWPVDKIRAKWQRLSSDPDIGAKQEFGHWLVPRFVGVFDDSVSADMAGRTCSRKRKQPQADELAQLHKEAEASQTRLHKVAASHMMAQAGSHAFQESGPDIIQGETSCPPLQDTTIRCTHRLERDMLLEQKRIQLDEEKANQVILEEAREAMIEKQRLADEKEKRIKNKSKSLDVLRLEACQWLSNQRTLLEQHMEAKTAQVTEITKDAESKISENIGDGYQVEQRVAHIDSLKQAFQAFKGETSTYIKKSLTGSIFDKCSDSDAITATKNSVATQIREVKKSTAQGNFSDAYGLLMKLMRNHEKLLYKKQTQKHDAIAEVMMSAQTLASFADSAGETWKDKFVIGPSGTEDAFADVKQAAIMISSSTHELATSIAQDPYFTKQSKWVCKHLKDTEQSSGSAQIMKPAFLSGLEKFIKTKFPASLHNRLEIAGADKEALESLFTPQFTTRLFDHSDVRPTPWMAGECRLQLTGTEWIYGMPAMHVPGDTHGQKSHTIQRLNSKQMTANLEESKAFMVQMTPGKLLRIPHACFLVTYVHASSTDTSQFLRWGHVERNTSVMEGVLREAKSISAHMTDGKEDKKLVKWIAFLEFELA